MGGEGFERTDGPRGGALHRTGTPITTNGDWRFRSSAQWFTAHPTMRLSRSSLSPTRLFLLPRRPRARSLLFDKIRNACALLPVHLSGRRGPFQVPPIVGCRPGDVHLRRRPVDLDVQNDLGGFRRTAPSFSPR